MKFRSVSFRYNYRDDDACNISYSCINLAHAKSDDENYRTLWIMTTKMHSTAKILKCASLPLISAIFIDIYYQSLRMVGASVGYLLKPPSVDLNRRQNIWIKCKKKMHSTVSVWSILSVSFHGNLPERDRLMKN